VVPSSSAAAARSASQSAVGIQQEVEIDDRGAGLAVVEQQHRRPQRQVDALRPVMRARPPVDVRDADRRRDVGAAGAAMSLLVHRCSPGDICAAGATLTPPSPASGEGF